MALLPHGQESLVVSSKSQLAGSHMTGTLHVSAVSLQKFALSEYFSRFLQQRFLIRLNKHMFYRFRQYNEAVARKSKSEVLICSNRQKYEHSSSSSREGIQSPICAT